MTAHIGERIEHAQRPSHHERRHRFQICDQFGDILPSPTRLIAMCRHIRRSLAARVERHDVILLRERLDLLSPDPGRHGPARHKDDGVAGARSGLQVVQPHPIAGLEVPVLRRNPGLSCRRPGHRRQQQESDNQTLAGGRQHTARTPSCAAPCQCFGQKAASPVASGATGRRSAASVRRAGAAR